ncbi:MAG: N-acetyltransferase [Lachnospiraceae bacterium]|nr:N-acetyltransferase [Lachnospiraceae bacterium]
MITIKTAAPEDLDAVMAIYHYAQEFMIRSGNPNQWGRSFPETDQIVEDIRQGICHVVMDTQIDDQIHGVFALLDTPDPTYSVIDNGAWLNDDPYMTIHRIAQDGRLHELVPAVFEFVSSLCDNIRVDTYKDNLIMQHQVEKCGFVHCGTIYVRDHSPRLAYHWVKKKD